MIEKWKPIKQYENYYEVSNCGRVRNLPRIVCCLRGDGKYISKSTINKPSPNEHGYGRVFLSVDGKVKTKYVHRLVADAWCKNPLNYNEVNHIDGIKANNSFDNLEWVTRKQNVIHSRIHGLFIPSPSKLNTEMVDNIITMRKNGIGRIIVANKYGIAPTTVTCITSGLIWAWHTNISKNGG